MRVKTAALPRLRCGKLQVKKVLTQEDGNKLIEFIAAELFHYPTGARLAIAVSMFGIIILTSTSQEGVPAFIKDAVVWLREYLGADILNKVKAESADGDTRND